MAAGRPGGAARAFIWPPRLQQFGSVSALVVGHDRSWGPGVVVVAATTAAAAATTAVVVYAHTVGAIRDSERETEERKTIKQKLFPDVPLEFRLLKGIFFASTRTQHK